MKRKANAPPAPAADRRSDDDRERTIDELVIQDDEPVENIYIEKQQHLLTDALYGSWRPPGKGRTFLAVSNVGLFPEKKQTPLVPDMMLSLDMPAPENPLERKEFNSYFLWIMGKPPDVVVEIVSDRRGGEAGHKMARYARIGVPYYVVYDPEEWLRTGVLRSFELDGASYQALARPWFARVKLGLKLWAGIYYGMTQRWLRWCDGRGRVLPTAGELAESERRRVEKLEAQLRAHGIEPSP